jgi:hypothetical protein|tara:strand:- start:207 stop:335 length:129 start_codon:yes stop_codon:yes gene_type:complete
MSGAGYFKHFYRHQILKNVFGIEPKEEPVEKKKNDGQNNRRP